MKQAIIICVSIAALCITALAALGILRFRRIRARMISDTMNVRIQALDMDRDNGNITDEEYAQRKAAIIKECKRIGVEF